MWVQRKGLIPLISVCLPTTLQPAKISTMKNISDSPASSEMLYSGTLLHRYNRRFIHIVNYLAWKFDQDVTVSGGTCESQVHEQFPWERKSH
ncbi:hypothetical protein F5Y12DRAFT_745722 [Xylaria sp. FL1777]|nr:hypothetical protein F5Y12DRAFT_745722 [Xylaria sp. FL1777]